MLNVLFSHLLPTQIMWEMFECLTIYSQDFILCCRGQWEVLKPRWGRKWAMWEWAGASWGWQALGRDGSASAIISSKPVSGSARQRGGAKISVTNTCVEVEWGVCFKWEAWTVWMKLQRKGGTERRGSEEIMNMPAAPLCELAERVLGESPYWLCRNDIVSYIPVAIYDRKVHMAESFVMARLICHL